MLEAMLKVEDGQPLDEVLVEYRVIDNGLEDFLFFLGGNRFPPMPLYEVST